MYRNNLLRKMMTTKIMIMIQTKILMTMKIKIKTMMKMRVMSQNFVQRIRKTRKITTMKKRSLGTWMHKTLQELRRNEMISSFQPEIQSNKILELYQSIVSLRFCTVVESRDRLKQQVSLANNGQSKSHMLDSFSNKYLEDQTTSLKMIMTGFITGINNSD